MASLVRLTRKLFRPLCMQPDWLLFASAWRVHLPLADDNFLTRQFLVFRLPCSQALRAPPSSAGL